MSQVDPFDIWTYPSDNCLVNPFDSRKTKKNEEKNQKYLISCSCGFFIYSSIQFDAIVLSHGNLK